ncbi:S-adenosyl-L-methionine-dependent methyltransferase [Xylariaceae sp. FL0016]|nr:S-adenosyl-L-methionine-dependent methyltransferase [Xylariaceae sp. FL0016]
MADGDQILSALSSAGIQNFELDPNARLKIVDAAKALVSRLQTNEEKVFEMTFSRPIVFASIQILLDIGLWEGWTKIGGGAKSVEDLSSLCKQDIEPNLLHRLLRLLASVNLVEETGEGVFQTNSFSRTFGDWNSGAPQSIQCAVLNWIPGANNLPRFLAKKGYREPLDTGNTNYQDWSPGNLDFFDKCVADPVYQRSFSGFMTQWAKYKVPWPQIFDTEALVRGADLDAAPLCVDIGGHHGVDLARLLDKHQDLPSGALVLQDLPEVVAGAKGLNEKIRIMPHDMFQTQPIKGARAYFFHAVLHDWPDDTAVLFLKKTAEAMKKGYSKLLIMDMALPLTGASWIHTTMDVNMMCTVSALERTEAMWTRLLQDAGFQIVKFWEDGRGNESLIEAELVGLDFKAPL